VRERRGLAYAVFCFSNLFAHSGEIGVYLGTRPEKLREAMHVLAGELERSTREPASAEELERSRENLKGRVVLSMESTAARMTYLGGSVLNALPILSVDELLERIDAVRMEDVSELARELYRPSALSLAGVGPAEGDFLAAIEPLGGAGAERGGAGAERAGAVAGQPVG
jgi:predicted Zn-dependent peptidase